MSLVSADVTEQFWPQYEYATNILLKQVVATVLSGPARSVPVRYKYYQHSDQWKRKKN